MSEQVDEKRPDEEEWTEEQRLTYGIDKVPPLAICLFLGLQHYLTMCVAGITVPILLAPALCMEKDLVGKSEITGVFFVISGIITFFQSLVGVRLPIVQTGTYAVLVPTLSYLSLPGWRCPNNIFTPTEAAALNISHESNNSIIIAGSKEHREIWMTRLREIQGCIMCASLLEILVGLTGLVGIMMRFIGPLTICPTVSLVGLCFFKNAGDMAAEHWGIAIATIIAMTIFSQCLGRFIVPCFICSKTGCQKHGFPIFKMFPIIFAIVIAWLLCYILTITDVLPKDPSSYGHKSRTDLKIHTIEAAPWFRIPYPMQWGLPTASIPGVLALVSGIVACITESIGDYYSCAKLCRITPPPIHAINRGILLEGLGTFLAGVFGTGNGSTSSSINVGIIGITKVASRSVVLVAALLMILFGVLIKFGALFLCIPNSVIGGSFFILFGIIVAVGLSNLQQVDLNSGRNLFIIGTSFFVGLAVPQWVMRNPDFIRTGIATLDNIIEVLLKTGIFIGGMTGFVLDNSIPGSRKTRGMHHWDKLRLLSLSGGMSDGLRSRVLTTYDIPLISKWLEKYRIFRYVPFLPTYQRNSTAKEGPLCCAQCEQDDDVAEEDVPNELLIDGNFELIQKIY